MAANGLIPFCARVVGTSGSFSNTALALLYLGSLIVVGLAQSLATPCNPVCICSGVTLVSLNGLRFETLFLMALVPVSMALGASWTVFSAPFAIRIVFAIVPRFCKSFKG